jgi:hypothetical protein
VLVGEQAIGIGEAPGACGRRPGLDCDCLWLIGGVGALKLAIERGVTGAGQTGVKPGTVQANIVDQEIT